MSEELAIRSHRGVYHVRFTEEAFAPAAGAALANAHVLVDRRVAELHQARLAPLLALPSVLRLEASEATKSLEQLPAYVDHLVSHGIRRDHVLVAIGGGIIQDVTCFLSSTLLRGIAWRFFPTTLLAQADSCVGSKSSINAGTAKNILGTFTPPLDVTIDTRFLDTLDERDLRSGIGEMLKAHAIEGPDAFNAIATDYPRLLSERGVLRRYLRQSLEIKKPYVEADEFDRGIRNVFNYGQSFGHAIEAATQFRIPHGIAVTIGCDMANHVAWRLGLADGGRAREMHRVFRKNFDGFETYPVPIDPFLTALSKDKKNVGSGTASLILPRADGQLGKHLQKVDETFRDICASYLSRDRSA